MARSSPLSSGSVTAVLWDIDGTLLTSGAVAAWAFLDAVSDVAGSRPDGAGLDLGGRIDPDIAAVLLASVGHDLALVPAVLARLEELVTVRVDDLNEHTRPLTGVTELVAMLADAGVRQTVVTGNVERVARLKLSAAGLTPPIDPDIGGFGDSGTTRAEVGRVALAKLVNAGWSKSLDQCWIVGDTPRDLDCARALGVRCALVGSGRRSAASLAALRPDVVLDSLGDPAPLLRLWQLDGE
jgi:phosphoglycolate phosphatase